MNNDNTPQDKIDAEKLNDTMALVAIEALGKIADMKNKGEQLAMSDALGVLTSLAALVIWSAPTPDDVDNTEITKRYRMGACKHLLAVLNITHEDLAFYFPPLDTDDGGAE